MTVSIAALNWQASSNNLGPLCNTTLNFAADTVYVFPHLAGNFTGVDVAPKFLVINNLDNDQKIVVVFDDAVIYPINPFQRLTLPVPAGSKRCQITATGAVPAAVVATFAVDDLSAADNFNFKGIQGIATDAKMTPIDYFGSVNVNIAATDLGRVKVFQNNADVTCKFPLISQLAIDLGTDANGFNFDIESDWFNANGIVLLVPTAPDVISCELPNFTTNVQLSVGMKCHVICDGTGTWRVTLEEAPLAVSPWQAITVSSTMGFAFVSPRLLDNTTRYSVELELLCVLGQLGYGLTEIVKLDYVDAATASSGVALSLGASTNVAAIVGSSIQIIRADTHVSAAITPANWNIRAKVKLQ